MKRCVETRILLVLVIKSVFFSNKKMIKLYSVAVYFALCFKRGDKFRFVLTVCCVKWFGGKKDWIRRSLMMRSSA